MCPRRHRNDSKRPPFGRCSHERVLETSRHELEMEELGAKGKEVGLTPKCSALLSSFSLETVNRTLSPAWTIQVSGGTLNVLLEEWASEWNVLYTSTTDSAVSRAITPHDSVGKNCIVAGSSWNRAIFYEIRSRSAAAG